MRDNRRINSSAGEKRLALSVSALFALTLFFFGPSHLYLYNLAAYDYTIAETLVFFFLVSAFFFLIFASAFVCSGTLRALIPFTFAASFLMWLQGNVLLWNYGLLDGSDIDWGKMHVYGLIDGSIWVSVLALAVRRMGFFKKAAYAGSIVLLLVQTTSLVILLAGAPGEAWTRYEWGDELRFRFSKARNVIFLILDTFQSDMFAEILSEKKDYKDIFDGFIYFPDSVGGYPTTYPSVPLLLTGRYYENSVPLRDFIKETYSSESSVPRVLKSKGYNVVLSTPEGYTVLRDSSTVSGLEERKWLFGGLKAEEAAALLDLTLFRYLPHYAKRLVFDENLNQPGFVSKMLGGVEDKDVQFIEEMQDGAAAADLQEAAFRFYHLRGVHIPYLLNESLEYEELKYTREGLKEFAKAKLKIAGMFLDKLKDIGAYDNALVFILADHGDRTPDFRSPAASGSPEDMSYLAPLVLVKPFGSRGPLRLSKVPASLLDIPATVFDALRIEAKAPGVSLFRLGESRPRQRRYLTYFWESTDWQMDYLTPMTEFMIEGFSWRRSSWRRTGRVYSKPGTKTSENLYFYGTYINFGTAGNAGRYAGKGWDEKGASGNITWTNERHASLRLPVIPTDYTVILEAKLESARDKAVKVVVKVNGNPEAFWTVENSGKYDALIPLEDIKDSRSLDITFDLTEAWSKHRPGEPVPSIGMQYLVLHGR